MANDFEMTLDFAQPVQGTTGFSVDVAISGVDNLLEKIDIMRKRIPEKMHTLLLRMSEIGITSMRSGFARAIYDGTPDYNIGQPYWRGKHILVLPVSGKTVAFIEFGTGVVYPDTHPDATRMGAIRGEYGLGHGKGNAWGYYGEPGTNGKNMGVNPKTGDTLVITHGNPANAPMYNAVKAMRDKVLETAKEVWAT